MPNVKGMMRFFRHEVHSMGQFLGDKMTSRHDDTTVNSLINDRRPRMNTHVDTAIRPQTQSSRGMISLIDNRGGKMECYAKEYSRYYWSTAIDSSPFLVDPASNLIRSEQDYAFSQIRHQLKNMAYDVECFRPTRHEYTHYFGLFIDTHARAYTDRLNSLILLAWLRHLPTKDISNLEIFGALLTTEIFLQKNRNGTCSSLLLMDINELLRLNEPFDRKQALDSFQQYCIKYPTEHMPQGIRLLGDCNIKDFNIPSTYLSHRKPF